MAAIDQFLEKYLSYFLNHRELFLYYLLVFENKLPVLFATSTFECPVIEQSWHYVLISFMALINPSILRFEQLTG